MPKVHAVIFDMDGVLIDAREWHYKAFNRALALFGMVVGRSDHLLTYDGLPTRRKLDLLSKERGLPVALHDFINNLKQQYTMELVHTYCKPRFQHEYGLARLKAEGYKLGVASNSQRETIAVMLRRASLIDYFDVSLSAQDVSVGKPDPVIYREAMQRLEVPPDECLIVEDNEHGIQAARGSGAHVMEVSDPSGVHYDSIVKRIKQIEASNC